MKRQKFLKGILASAALFYVPGSMLLAKNKSVTDLKRVHIIGLGGAGGNIVEYIHSKGVRANYSCVGELRAGRDETIRFVPFNKDFQTSFEDDNMPSLNFSNELIPFSFIKEDEAIILVAGLGGFTGTVLSVYLSKKLRAKCKEVHLLATTPFMYEKNSSRQRYTEYALHELRNTTNIHLVSNESYRKEYGHLPFNEYFEKINEMFLENVMKIIG